MNGKADKNEPSIMTLCRRIGKKEPNVRKRTDKIPWTSALNSVFIHRVERGSCS